MYVISGRPRRHIRPRTVRQAPRGRDEASRKIRRGPRYVPRRLTAGTPHLGPSPPRAGATLAPPLRPVPAVRARTATDPGNPFGTATAFDKCHHPAKRPAGRIRTAAVAGESNPHVRQSPRYSSLHGVDENSSGQRVK